ncbi:hypothetical protein EB74_30015 [Mycobacterium sp. SWH-M5]|uniref:hypothetical protein n=1 Tax=Mycolicibacterium goodii TaxID=134601 RepID=UPI00093F8104|nr:hypothetical protein [Mycolicibacterium goodii]MBU8817543.1 hypothetical protein [Mycolicibacterium goodii]OKH69402.1 hypothetical protein EB74_30015 [Mycobacterium sp. SWH-M5]
MSIYVSEDEWEAERRESAGPALAARIDRLRDWFSASGPGTAVELPADAGIPDWLRSALSRAELTEAEGPWPGWARCWSGVDWPRLIAEHPDSIGVDEYALTRNAGIEWATVVEFWNMLGSRKIPASLDVELSIDVDEAPGRVELFLYELVVHPTDSGQISDITDCALLREPDRTTDCRCGKPTLTWFLA